MSRVILGIETSCDETAAAVVGDDLSVASSVVASQVDVHALYGGVVPEIASRMHLEVVMSVVSRALIEAGVTGDELEAIAVTRGPGLIGALLVGISTAKGLALAWDKPIIGVNHLEGHLASAALTNGQLAYPCVVLLVSGGHTMLAEITEPGRYTLLGTTRDDSAGEAYDKVARLLGLGYPGGPAVDRLAATGLDCLDFPRPMLAEGLDFSFSGLKTAVANYVRKHPDYVIEDVAASFAAASMDVLAGKLERAVDGRDVASVAVVGGVSASPLLRERVARIEKSTGIPVVLPPLDFATDNGAMIAAAGWLQLGLQGPDRLDFSALPNLGLPVLGTR